MGNTSTKNRSKNDFNKSDFSRNFNSINNEWYKFSGIGFVAGMLSGLLGVGGGILLVPLLTAYFGMTQHQAQATSLAVVVPTGIAASMFYGLHGNIDGLLAAEVAFASIAAAMVGISTMKKLSGERLKALFGAMLTIVGIGMMLR